MTRINTNLNSIVGQNILSRNQSSLQTTLTRLSTGLRINSGKDDPAGLIVSDVFKRELTSLDTSIKNTQRGNNIVATVDAALKEVGSLLNDVRGLIQASANKGATSADEIASNQVQVDSALDTIARIGQTTVFGGDKLLNGNKGFAVAGSLASFQSTADITVSAFNPALHTSTANDDVTINVTQAATHKTLVFSGTGNGGANDDLAELATGANTVLEIIGDKGRSVITINNDSVIADNQAFIDAVNAVKDVTGVTASGAGASGAVTLTSSKYGSDAVVAVNAISGSTSSVALFNDQGTSGTHTGISTAGVNAAGTVTTGLSAGAFTAVGEKISYIDSNISLSAVTDPALSTGSSNFDVTGGALFQLGASVNFANQVNINIPGIDLATLGRNFSSTGVKALSALRSGGTDELNKADLSTAASIVDQAISQISTLRGRLGALQKNVFESNINSLQSAFEQVTQAQSSITDADFATETANLTKNQILVQAGTSVLSIANSAPQSVLALLQR